MAFDGAFTHVLMSELEEAKESRIDKIYQPSQSELVFLIRKKGFAKKLLLCARSGSVRIQFTEQKYENPAEPPMFCMLARKHFTGAKLIGMSQCGFDRIVTLVFENYNEMGDKVKLQIVCELIGNRGNIVLLDKDGRIIDAVRRSDIESERLILPGAVYEYPKCSNKLSPVKANLSEIVEKILCKEELPLDRAIMDTVDGFSPLVCREIAFLCSAGEQCVFEFDDPAKLENVLFGVFEKIENGAEPVMLCDRFGEPKEYSYLSIKQYGEFYTEKSFESFSLLLDAFYSGKDTKQRIDRLSCDVSRLVSGLILRAQKRLAARKADLKACENRDELRIFGELIKANIHLIESGSAYAVVQNFYDENLSEIKIPLSVKLSPAANAAEYFKEYKKSCTAVQTLKELIDKDVTEIQYLESVAESLERCTCYADIEAIRQELFEGGYLRTKKQQRKPQKTALKPKEYVSKEGYRIAVGRNNIQNDYLTVHLASKNDMWFHTKAIHGAHVVVFCDGAELDDETVLFAAELAAANSKASKSQNVPVDYTRIKYVKKPNGAKPGMVIYTTNKTVYVTPKENVI